MKLLFYGESPLNPTGFGNVNKHLAAAFSKVADVTMIASTHYRETYDKEAYPYTIIGCDPTTPYEKRTIENQANYPVLLEHINSLDWDVFAFQGDMG